MYRKAFANPEECKSCHPQHFDEWSKSMHAYSMKDVAFLILDSIRLAHAGGNLGEYGQLCIECHSPTAILVDNIPDIASLNKISPVTAHGISCDVCHQLSPNQPPNSNSMRFTGDGVRRGSIKDPMATPYHTSLYDSSFSTSEACMKCHDMYLPNGYLLERTYTEWTHSPFPGREISCQSCHMKFYRGTAATGGPERDRVHHHSMISVNIPLVDFPGKEERMAEIQEVLNYSVKMDVQSEATVSASAKNLPIKINVMNVLTGHSIPSGPTFQRQMWIAVIAKDERGDTLFTTGLLDKNGDLCDGNSDEVRQGRTPFDSNLVLYTSTVYKHGAKAPFSWQADYLLDRTIPAFDSRISYFNIPVPQRNGATITLDVRLYYRVFPPYMLRSIGMAKYIDKIPSFEMEKYSGTISVK